MVKLKRLTFVLVALLTLTMLVACGNRDNHDYDYDDYGYIYGHDGYLEDYGVGYEEYTGTREPLHLAYYTPHGYLSVRHIEFMNDHLYGRTPFSYREKETALWIVEELLAMGFDPSDIEVQEFSHNDVSQWTRWSLGDTIGSWARTTVGNNSRNYSQNVILTIPGQSEQKIIVGAHYDTLPYPGASDNASGTALLLESAQRMLHLDNYYTIVYVFFGAEEIGLLGAYFYYDNLTRQQRDNIVMMINADVLFEGEFFFYGAGYAGDQGPGTNHVSQQVNAIAQQVRDTHGIEIATLPQGIFLPSDQLVFLWEGHTVVQFSGLYKQPSNDFTGWAILDHGDYALTARVLHSDEDCIHIINYRWPGKIDTAMRTFSVFLEELLLARYTN